MTKTIINFYLFLFMLTCACSRGPLSSKNDLFRVTSPPTVFDAWGDESFKQSLKLTIEYLNKNPEQKLLFGEYACTRGEYALKLNELFKIMEEGKDWQHHLKNNFEWLEVYGKDDWSEVLVTGYFEPLILGDTKPSEKFSHPILQAPAELHKIDLKQYTSFLPAAVAAAVEQEPSVAIKIYQSPKNDLLPFPDREGISKIPFNNWKNPPLAWIDPIDAFFLQVQGSGTIKTPQGMLRVGYAEQNGYPYVPIGKFLTDKIPLENMSMQAIEQHLKSLPPEEAEKILNKNKSYVFMKPTQNNAITYSGVPATAGRTIATDKDLFPKGALAFLRIHKNEDKALSQFVFDLDTGGAIKGPGRVDFFTGRGDMAKEMAGPMKNKGALYYLFPKKF